MQKAGSPGKLLSSKRHADTFSEPNNMQFAECRVTSEIFFSPSDTDILQTEWKNIVESWVTLETSFQIATHSISVLIGLSVCVDKRFRINHTNHIAKPIQILQINSVYDKTSPK